MLAPSRRSAGATSPGAGPGDRTRQRSTFFARWCAPRLLLIVDHQYRPAVRSARGLYRRLRLLALQHIHGFLDIADRRADAPDAAARDGGLSSRLNANPPVPRVSSAADGSRHSSAMINQGGGRARPAPRCSASRVGSPAWSPAGGAAPSSGPHALWRRCHLCQSHLPGRQRRPHIRWALSVRSRSPGRAGARHRRP